MVLALTEDARGDYADSSGGLVCSRVIASFDARGIASGGAANERKTMRG